MDVSESPINDEEFVAMVARQQPLLRAVVRSMVPGCSEVDDILQETNMVLWRKRNSFEPGSQFAAWSGTIARFQVLAWLKKNKTDQTVGFEPQSLEQIASAATDGFGNLGERRIALNACLSELPEADRELIQHRYFRRAPLAEFARQQGKSEAAISKTLERLRSRLRECINQRLAME